MSDIEQFLNKKILANKDFIQSKNTQGARQNLWHAIKVENCIQAIADNELKPYTSHRYWPDGKRYKESDLNYEDSFWMYGWSTTRQKEYAMGWNSVVLELNFDKIKQNFEIKPFSWNYLFSHNNKMKKQEFEEFIISHYEPKSIPQLKQDQEDRIKRMDDIYDIIYAKGNDKEQKERLQQQYKEELDQLDNAQSWMKEWQSPKGKGMDFSKVVEGIYVEKFAFDLYNQRKGNEKNEFDMIISHPAFKGIFENPRQKMKSKNNLKI